MSRNADRFPSAGCFVGTYWLSRRGHSRQWCRTWFDAGSRQTRRISLGTPDLERARAELARWWAVNAQLRQEEPASVLLRDLVLRHVERAAPGKRSKNQITRSLLLLDDRFPGCTVAGLTPGMLEDWGRELVRAGRSGSYVRRILTDVRSMLNRARKRSEVLAVPFVPVGLFEEGEGRKRLVSAEEVARLFLAADENWLRRFVMIGAGTGARTEAILELLLFQVDRKHGLIRFNREGRKQTKKVRPTVRLAPRLRPWVEPRKGGDGRVVGRGVKAFGIAWRAARKRSGLGEDVVPTTFRHTLATLMKERRVAREQRDDWFGWAQGARTGDHYEHERMERDEYLKDALAVADDWLDEIEQAIGRLREQAADQPSRTNVKRVRASRVPVPALEVVPPDRIELSTSPLPRNGTSAARR